jgi:pseudouridine-5'-phosphate glycosidase
MRPFITANQQLGIQSAGVMTQDPAAAPTELSGSEIESVIDRSTERIAEAASAITLREYTPFIPT